MSGSWGPGREPYDDGVIMAPGRGFVLLSLPKVASTALETALAAYHEPLPGRAPDKHQSLAAFHERTAPRLASLGHARDRYDVVCLFRDPVAWLESWWRYRQRPEVRRRRPERWTGDTPFDAFARQLLDDKPTTGIKGRPAAFLAGDPARGVRLDRVFAVDRPEVWSAWLAGRVGAPVVVPRRNVARADRAPSLPPALRRRLEDYFAPEYDVMTHLDQGDGAWVPPIGYRPPGLGRDTPQTPRARRAVAEEGTVG